MEFWGIYLISVIYFLIISYTNIRDYFIIHLGLITFCLGFAINFLDIKLINNFMSKYFLNESINNRIRN